MMFLSGLGSCNMRCGKDNVFVVVGAVRNPVGGG